MLFAYLKRILGLGRLRLRGPCGAKDEFLLAATTQIRRLFSAITGWYMQKSPARVEFCRLPSLNSHVKPTG